MVGPASREDRVHGVRDFGAVLGTLAVLTTVGCRAPHASCDETAQCLAREVCYLGWCRTSCNTLDQCLAGEACRQGMCLPASLAPADAGVVDRAAQDRSVVDAAGPPEAAAGEDRGPEAGPGEASVVDTVAAADAGPADLAAGDGSSALDGPNDRDVHTTSLDGGVDGAQPGDAARTDDGASAGDAATDAWTADGSAEDADLGCSLRTVFWDHPATCRTRYTCRYHPGQDQASCETMLPLTVAPYAACSAPDQCPPGTVSMPMVDGTRCMPVCSTDHPVCPTGPGDAGARCTHELPVDSGMALCEYNHACNPLDAGGCDVGFCFLASPITVCAEAVDAGTAGAACSGWRDCAPTHACHLGRCRQFCNPMAIADCSDAGACQPLDASIWSVCVPIAGDAGVGGDVYLGADGGGAAEAGDGDGGTGASDIT